MKNVITRKDRYIIQCILSVIFLIVSTSASSLHSSLKPRLVVLTDISLDEPDDHQSLIRLLAHADMYEIEGIVLTTGWSVRNPTQDMAMALGAIDAYESDLPNLMKRSSQIGFAHDNDRQQIGYWPSAQYLRNRTVFGSMKRGMQHIGANNNSAGSDLIIQLADEDDDRPIWVTFWGGGNTLAQSIWKVQQTRSQAELKTFLNKVRAYAIADQDRGQNDHPDVSSHTWMINNFSNDLLFIEDNAAWWYFVGHAKNDWANYQTHIQNHGNLGSRYPNYKYGVEGDTPSFLHLMPNGLNNPDVPTQAGWGGYSEWGSREGGFAYVNRQGPAHTICKNKYAPQFYPATFNNFAARMDWAKDGKGNLNPIAIINGNKGIEILKETPLAGTTITLDASTSYDPDDDQLIFKWWVQPEAGTYNKGIILTNANTSKVNVKVPDDSAGETFHVICEITDNGVPNLTSYRRIIVEPKLTNTLPPATVNVDFTTAQGYVNGDLSTQVPTDGVKWTAPATHFIVDATAGKVSIPDASAWQRAKYNRTFASGTTTFKLAMKFSFDRSLDGAGEHEVFGISLSNVGTTNLDFLFNRLTGTTYRLAYFIGAGDISDGADKWKKSPGFDEAALGLGPDDASSDELTLEVTITKGSDADSWTALGKLLNRSTEVFSWDFGGAFKVGAIFHSSASYYSGFAARKAMADTKISNRTVTSFQATVPIASGLDVLGAEAAIIYPNPVKDVLNVSSSDVKKIEIFNLSGKSVKSFQLKGSQVDVSELAKGVYVVRLIGSTTAMSKFVKK